MDLVYILQSDDAFYGHRDFIEQRRELWIRTVSLTSHRPWGPHQSGPGGGVGATELRICEQGKFKIKAYWLC